MHNKKKTIFLALSFPMSVRNLLKNNFFEYLTDRYQVVVFSMMTTDTEFIKEFKRENVHFCDLKFDFKKGLFCRIIYKMHRYGDRYHFATGKKMHGAFLNRYLYKANLKDERRTRFFGFLFNIFPKFNLWAERYLKEQLKSTYYQKMINAFKPDLVFISHPYIDSESQLILNAKNNHIPTIGLIHSWDNITSKGRMHNVPDQIVVWNKIMRKEISSLYNGLIKDENIHFVGIPQHDYLFVENWKEDRNFFFKRMGLDPDRKVITYISRGDKNKNNKEPENIETIIKGINDGHFVKQSQLLIREVAGWDRVQFNQIIESKSNNVVYDVPDVSHRPNIDNKNAWKNDSKASHHLGNLLYYSDVIICFASTITLDSIYFDVPVIWPLYPREDGSRKTNNQKVLNLLSWSHIQPLLNLNAFPLPKKPKDLLTLINDALENPKRLSEERKRVLEAYCPFNDGKAGVRIAKIIEKTLESN